MACLVFGKAWKKTPQKNRNLNLHFPLFSTVLQKHVSSFTLTSLHLCMNKCSVLVGHQEDSGLLQNVQWVTLSLRQCDNLLAIRPLLMWTWCGKFCRNVSMLWFLWQAHMRTCKLAETLCANIYCCEWAALSKSWILLWKAKEILTYTTCLLWGCFTLDKTATYVMSCISLHWEKSVLAWQEETKKLSFVWCTAETCVSLHHAEA